MLLILSWTSAKKKKLFAFYNISLSILLLSRFIFIFYISFLLSLILYNANESFLLSFLVVLFIFYFILFILFDSLFLYFLFLCTYIYIYKYHDKKIRIQYNLRKVKYRKSVFVVRCYVNFLSTYGILKIWCSRT